MVGDALLFEQVILNLVLNSRDVICAVEDSAPDRREILISLSERDDKEVSIEVRDYGSGIPVTLRTRIFDPFFTTKPTGTGLGLALSFGIMRDMGGSIQLVDSDVGACFRLTLRAAQLED